MGRIRNTELGDRAAFCVDCGWARRYHPDHFKAPAECPACDGKIRSQCPDCGEDILSIMAVECDVCGGALRNKQVHGIPIHRTRKHLPMIE